MFLARVVGSVWSTIKWPELGGLKLLLVRPYGLEELSREPRPLPRADLVVCADVLDAGVGDEVVVAYGHAARVAVSQVLGESDRPNVPIDAAIVAVVDRVQVTVPEGS
jgi:ethanolamine utilization protein EutN